MGKDLAVVCYFWNDGSRAYRPVHVNILARLYRENLSVDHCFVCVTDEPGDYSEDVTVLPLPESAQFAASLQSPHGPRYPSSYRRLWTFSREAAELGKRILLTDIDCIVTRDVTPLIEFMGDATFVGWRPSTTWGSVKRVAGGNWLLKAGAHTEVWERFSIDGLWAAQKAGQRGSDQSWISHCLAANCAVWPKLAGLYEAQWMRPNKFEVLPPTARIVHFNGVKKPWDMLHVPWIRERWH